MEPAGGPGTRRRGRALPWPAAGEQLHTKHGLSPGVSVWAGAALGRGGGLQPRMQGSLKTGPPVSHSHSDGERQPQEMATHRTGKRSQSGQPEGHRPTLGPEARPSPRRPCRILLPEVLPPARVRALNGLHLYQCGQGHGLTGTPPWRKTNVQNHRKNVCVLFCFVSVFSSSSPVYWEVGISLVLFPYCHVFLFPSLLPFLY